MTRVKALSVLQCREYVLEQHGAAAVDLIKARLSPQAREAFYADELLAVDWIEVAYALEHALVYDELFGTGDGKASDLMLHELTRRHFNGIYRAVFAGATPQAVLEKSSRLWQRYYDRGESKVEFHGDQRALKRIYGCDDQPVKHERLLLPYYEEMLRQAGAKDVTTKHVLCVATGAEYCETDIRWK